MTAIAIAILFTGFNLAINSSYWLNYQNAKHELNNKIHPESVDTIIYTVFEYVNTNRSIGSII